MSKTGVNSATVKQENNQLKKDSRVSSSNTSNIKDEKRSSDSFTNQGRPSQNRGPIHHGNQQNENRNRDRSGNRNDSRQYEKNTPETKSNDKEEKGSSDPSAVPAAEKKFTGRCRLFVGNLTPDVTEDEFRKMFEVYGEVSEVYANSSRGFGFIRLDYRQNAEAAKAALDGLQRKGRVLRVRFATHGAALKVKNLHQFVSNELLEQSFSQFGDLERCVVIVDDRGKSTGEGIVEFVRKPGANSALRRITEGVFLMGVDPKPIAVEPLEQKDEEDGLPEKFLTINEQYKKEREKEPRFAPPGTFEYEFGMRWKQIEEVERQRIEQAKKDTIEARLKLEDEMQNALYEYQADQIRQDLLRQQEELRRLEELRNQDRMRRQQERHQQEERERAQQEERRRADAMMMMRQQDLARGRGSMDISGMKGREQMMMADRYADRMGDRMPVDRLSDRMGDRMSDRMGDRMGQGQPGFMWDDKQRGDAGMRGEAGRGPPVPLSSLSAMERGGPVAATTSVAAQGTKTSPKPLMQGGGFGNMGSTPGGGQGPNAADASAMDEDYTDETDTSQFQDAEETSDTDIPSDDLGKHEACLATFRSPDITSEDHVSEDSPAHRGSQAWICASQTETGTCNSDSAMHVDLLEADASCRSVNGIKDLNNSTCTTSSEVTSPRASNTTSDNLVQNMSNNDSELPNNDVSSKFISCPVKLYHHLPCQDDQATSKCQCGDKVSYTHQIICEHCEKSKSIELDRLKSTESVISCSDTGSKILNANLSINFAEGKKTLYNCEVVKELSSKVTSKAYMVVNDRKCYSPINHCHQSSNTDASSELHELPANIDEESVLNEEVSINQNISQSSRMDHCSVENHLQDSYQSSDGAWHEPLSGNSQSDLPDQFSQTSISTTQEELEQIPKLYTTKVVGSEHFDSSTDITDSVSKESNYSTKEASVEASCSSNDSITCQLYKQQVTEENNHSESLTKVAVSSCEQKETSDPDSCYEQMVVKNNTMLINKQTSNNEISSYKQFISNDGDEMDTETLDDDDDATHVSVNSSVYQSYEEQRATHICQIAATAGLIVAPDVAQYDASDNPAREVNLSDGMDSSAILSGANISSAETSDSSSTCISAQNTVSETPTSSAEDQVLTSTSSPSSSSSMSTEQALGSNSGDQEVTFSQGDQAFIAAAARQQASVPFMPAGCSLPYVPGINPSMYAGAAMVQGIPRPTVMTSSSVHFAQHPSGATIMQHQSMSTGLNGSMSRSTVMQQQAMSNGVQATSVMQRTLTNRGQTMVVQQRTMTTGLDGVTQQTVVQQQVATPSMAQAALFHANALRQRTMATQQASMMQQRGIRLVQTGVMGSPMLHAQTLGGPALIQGRAIAPTALIGHGLFRGVGQGTMMQQLVRQRYLGGPVMPGRGVQLMAGRPIRVKMTYPRESMQMDT